MPPDRETVYLSLGLHSFDRRRVINCVDARVAVRGLLCRRDTLFEEKWVTEMYIFSFDNPAYCA